MDPDGHCSWNPWDGDSCESQPFKAGWETGQNIVGFTGGFIYEAPGAAKRWTEQTVGGIQYAIGAAGGVAVSGGQCMLDTSCGIHNVQDAWNTFSSDPEGALRAAWADGVEGAKNTLAQLAYAGADMADKFEQCKARNDYFCFGQESAELTVGIEGNGLAMIYGGKALVNLVKGLPAAAAAIPAAARNIPAIIKSLPARLFGLPATGANTARTIAQSIRALPQALDNLVTKINKEVFTPGGKGWSEVWHHNDFLRGGPGSVTKQNVPSWCWDSTVTSPAQTRLPLPWRLATGKGPFPFSAHFDPWDLWKLAPLLGAPVDNARDVLGGSRR